MKQAPVTGINKMPSFSSRPLASRGAPWNYAAALALVAITVMMATPLLGRVDLANIVLLFLLPVLATAALWGRGPAVFGSVLGVAAFDFFFVPPRFSFTVDQAQYLITFGAMLLVSLVVTHLTTAYREKADESERRALEAGLLHEVAGKLSGTLSIEDVTNCIHEVVDRKLGARCRIFLATNDPTVALQASDARPVELPEMIAAKSVFEHGRAIQAASYLSGEAKTDLWPLDGISRRRGVLAVEFDPQHHRPAEGFLQAISALVCTAIERIHFVEVAHTSALDIQSERLRNSLLSAISHDVRTPLTVIFGLADALANIPGTTGEIRTKSLALRHHAMAMHRMVANLLDMARLQSGRIVLHREWQSIPELFAACIDSLGEGIDSRRLKIDWMPIMPLMHIDGMLMERVFCNLIENAVKYSPPDSPIRISASQVGEELCIRVDNDGAHLPFADADEVFGMFERGTREPSVPGVGLGLAICRAIVDFHDGRIRGENLAQGVRFEILLPLQKGPAMPTEEDGND